MSKKSKQIENRVRASEYVMMAAKTHREQIAEVLATRAVAAQGSNTLVTKDAMLALVDFLVDDLKHSVVTMDNAEMRVVAERADDVGLRDTRDTAASNLYLATVRVRSMVVDALGPNGIATYGLEGETPKVARDLTSHATTVATLMQEHPFNVTVDGVTFDSAAMASTLMMKADAVEKTLADMQREEQELVSQLGNRNAAITDWVDVHQGVADTLTGLFRLAGRKILADRVRPSTRTLAGDETLAPETPNTSEGPTSKGSKSIP